MAPPTPPLWPAACAIANGGFTPVGDGPFYSPNPFLTYAVTRQAYLPADRANWQRVSDPAAARPVAGRLHRPAGRPARLAAAPVNRVRAGLFALALLAVGASAGAATLPPKVRLMSRRPCPGPGQRFPCCAIPFPTPARAAERSGIARRIGAPVMPRGAPIACRRIPYRAG